MAFLTWRGSFFGGKNADLALSEGTPSPSKDEDAIPQLPWPCSTLGKPAKRDGIRGGRHPVRRTVSCSQTGPKPPTAVGGNRENTESHMNVEKYS